VTRAAGPTGGLRVWHPTLQIDTVVPGAIRNPSWSPDGTQIVYQRLDRLGTNQHFESTFSRDADFTLALSEPFPSFSPDGSRLLYSQYGPGRSTVTGLDMTVTGNTSVEIMAADGTAKRTLFKREGFSVFSAVWSPAGDDIALSVGRYFRAAGLPPAQIALVKPDGSSFRVLVDDALNNGFPSPRTDVILFTSDRFGRFALHTIRPDGTGLRQLTPGTGIDAHASWCGDWIVFTSGRMGFKDEMALYDQVPQPYGEIFAMRTDGSDVRQLTDNKWEDASATCAQAAR
jgi:Tol biopolymer transport system component